ncbi:nuclease-related domain-containing protein [Alkalicoccus urumqiensis]|uniref:NERD domain-containing protein n=1 Tax=Alkalicoccus urumqiensis TaxID=1548213 RepID=A0A2P6MHU5_ALKUR|nr:nuclease-related domain-containing protein [Alkalicoccus urumqiensis]PRO65820.1 hypothetical protein C6I21_07945 [Alkalicoccus urumqiensis]
MPQSTQSRPFIIDQLEALLRRLPPHHPKREEVAHKLLLFQVGAAGEASLDYYLQQLPDHLTVLRHITLPAPGEAKTFQIDLLLLSPSFVFIGEVKHIAGELQFDVERGQMIRTSEEGKDVFTCPVRQSERQAYLFEKWLEKHRFPKMPVLPNVLISNRKAQITAPDHIPSIYHTAVLPSKAAGLAGQLTEPLLSKSQFRRLTKKVTAMNIERPWSDLLQRFHLSLEDILGPLQCKVCFENQWMKKRSGWKCAGCGVATGNMYVEALGDIRLLTKEPLRRRDLQRVFEGVSKRTALRILQKHADRCGLYYQLRVKDQ